MLKIRSKKKRIFIPKVVSGKALMREWDPARVCALMIESARIAKGMFSSFKWSRKEDSSLVTKADIAIEKLFSKYCDCPEENVFFIGEETVDSKSEEYIKNAMSGVAWIIDPIDGTAPFACNIPTWGISVAFAVDGIIKDGAIYLPSAGEIYISYEGESYFSDKILGSTRYINLSKIPPPSANIASGALISISQDVAKKGRMEIENPVQAVCCSVFSAAGLLRNRYAAFVGTMKLWDIAGAIPILINRGFKIETRDGFKVGREINPTTCHLNHDDPKMRWRYRSNLIICADKKSIGRIRKAIS